MNLLVYEHITGGGFIADALPQSLAQEGDLMLQALVRDLASLPDIRLWVCRDARLPMPNFGNAVRVLSMQLDSDVLLMLDEWMRDCDAVWLIAPETGGVLEQLCARVQAAGKQLLTSPVAGVRVCGDKSRTFEVLRQHAIATIPTHALLDNLTNENQAWVVKARDGAGCADSFIVTNLREYQIIKMSLGDAGNYILQPFLPGKPVSLSCLFKNGQGSMLSYNEQQIIIRNGHFELQGCIVNASCPDWLGYQQLVSRIAQAFPDLWGYAGIDLLETDEGPVVVEINPRLTTSYTGLQQALNLNIAREILTLLHDDLRPSVQRGQAVMVSLAHADAA